MYRRLNVYFAVSGCERSGLGCGPESGSVSGSVQTFPVYIYVAAQRGIPPQANVIASAVFLLAIIGTLAYGIVNARRAAVRRGR